jgi:hypothetical protein
LAVLDQESPADVGAAAAGRFKQVLAEVGECWLGGRFFPIVSSELPQKQTLVDLFFSWILFIFGTHVYSIVGESTSGWLTLPFIDNFSR